jgi:hypothetical protein
MHDKKSSLFLSILSFLFLVFPAFSDEYADFQRAIDYDKLMTQVVEQTREEILIIA